MLYHILSYNRMSGIAKIMEAPLLGNDQISPSSFQILGYINPNKIPNNFEIKSDIPYSFILRDQTVDGNFVRAELDYKSPVLKGIGYANSRYPANLQPNN